MRTGPGLTVWTRIPRGASSAATPRENATCACFEAAYGPDEPPTEYTPATEATLTTSEGAPASSSGRNARSDHTLPR